MTWQISINYVICLHLRNPQEILPAILYWRAFTGNKQFCQTRSYDIESKINLNMQLHLFTGVFCSRDDVMAWKRYPKRPVIQSFTIFSIVILNKMLNKVELLVIYGAMLKIEDTNGR